MSELTSEFAESPLLWSEITICHAVRVARTVGGSMSSDDLFGDVADADFLALAGQLDATSAPRAPPASVPAAQPPARPSQAANPPKATPSRPLRPAFNSIIVNSRQVINKS